MKPHLQYDIVILGGLAGRLDHTIHTLSYLHKLRNVRERVYAVTDDNIGWVLKDGEHEIDIDHTILGPTCGLLPVGIDETILTTRGLRWNLGAWSFYYPVCDNLSTSQQTRQYRPSTLWYRHRTISSPKKKTFMSAHPNQYGGPPNFGLCSWCNIHRDHCSFASHFQHRDHLLILYVFMSILTSNAPDP